MNYFEILGIKPAFQIDAAQLKKAYFAVSRATHPDHYEGDSQLAEEKSAQVNLAYATLKDPLKRMAYILNMHGLLSENDTMSPDFLMDMMEINEQLMELEMDPNPNVIQQITQSIDDLEHSWQRQVLPSIKAFDTLGELSSLVVIRDYYYKTKYLVRVKENLDKFASA